MNFYKNGNYTVQICNDGTKIRRTEDDEFIPAFAENVDVKITSKCKIGCSFCYEACTKDGEHGDLLSYRFIRSLHPYTEMALNGNDLDHPQLMELLQLLKSQHVFANMTVHQNQFMNNLELIDKLASEKLIHGIGVSYNHYNEKFIEAVQKYPNAVLHTINGIITADDLNRLKGKNLKLLILGYKNLRRGESYLNENNSYVEKNQKDMYDMLKGMIDENWFKVISFDNNAINQLDVKRLMDDDKWDEFYMGDDGKYTFYIDMVDGTFGKNSLSTKRYEIGNKTIDEMFKVILENN